SFAGWIREGEQKATSTVQVKFSEDDQWSTTGRRPKFDPWVGLKWEAADGPEPTIERERTGGSWTPTRGPWSENPKGWFLAGYGPFRRLSSASSEALRLMMSPGRPTALASLFREDASLSESIQWLQTVYLHRLESRGDAEKPRTISTGPAGRRTPPRGDESREDQLARPVGKNPGRPEVSPNGTVRRLQVCLGLGALLCRAESISTLIYYIQNIQWLYYNTTAKSCESR